jgi:hypothetical protein
LPRFHRTRTLLGVSSVLAWFLGLLVAVLMSFITTMTDRIRPGAPREIRGARSLAQGAIAVARQFAGA